MSRQDLTPFQKTRLALAVAALSASLGACSSMPREEGPVGMLADAGRTTTDSGSGLWDRTMYLLGFSDEAKAESRSRMADRGTGRLAGRGDGALLDEVDLALMQEDAVMPSPNAVDVVRSPAWTDTASAGGATQADEELFDGERVLVESAVDGEALQVSTSDLTHEVTQSETLWDIAKMTTGDATNWHVLADVNDLAPDASVHPGQTLLIPADLVRPELAGFTTTADAAARPATSQADANASDDSVADLDPATDGTEFRLGAGETLWDFSRRTTGDATNWRAIADANGFSDEQATRVYENMRITVPTALLRDDESGDDGAAASLDVADAAGESTETDDITRDVLVPIADAADVATDAAAPAGAKGDEADPLAEADTDTSRPIRIVEAAYRADPDGLAADTAATSASGGDVGGAAAAVTTIDAAAGNAAEAVAGAAQQEIMVSGTYYPKAVYNDADFSSSLLMRVSPGTTLQVSRAVGSWYEVTTDQGTGYVHARDIK